MKEWQLRENVNQKPSYAVITTSKSQWLKTPGCRSEWFSWAVVLHVVTQRPSCLDPIGSVISK